VETLFDRLAVVEGTLIQTKAEARQDPINFPPMLDTQIGYLYRYVAFTYGRPGRPAYDRFNELQAQVVEGETGVREILDELVAGINEAVAAAGLSGIVVRR